MKSHSFLTAEIDGFLEDIAALLMGRNKKVAKKVTKRL